MTSFSKNSSLSQFQAMIEEIYGLPDDCLFSLSDLLSNQQRFTMRALKGIRKGDIRKLKLNLLIAFSWFMAVTNRFHIDIETAVWERFPMCCSYCGSCPCDCKKIKPTKRAKVVYKHSLKPGTLAGLQDMFNAIYPSQFRTLPDAGVHLAEEMGEVSEAVHHFMGEHKKIIFQSIIEEMADYVSCIFGVANSAKISVSSELAKMYSNNCHVCHKSSCECSFSFISKLKS